MEHSLNPRIAIVQTASLTGDIDGNAKHIIASLHTAQKHDADIIVFPKYSLCGPGMGDFVRYDEYIQMQDSAIQRIAQEVGSAHVIISGIITKTDEHTQREEVFSTAIILHESVAQIACSCPEHHVTHSQDPLAGYTAWQYESLKIGIKICRESDAHLHASHEMQKSPDKKLPFDMCIALSSFAFCGESAKKRQITYAHTAEQQGCATLLVNAVGAQDGTVYDGKSCFVNAFGKILWQAPTFSQTLSVIHMEDDKAKPLIQYNGVSTNPHHPWEAIHTIDVLPQELSQEEEMILALEHGIRGYLQYSGFSQVLVGLSGGIDSALTAVLATRALGADKVLGVLMPSMYSSEASIKDAEALARIIGIRTHILHIEKAYHVLMDTLAPAFDVEGGGNTAEENIQARIRGILLMGIANKHGRLLLSTGNKSEAAVGYCTLYGDTCGALSVIGDIFKTEVYALSRYINKHGEVIPHNTLKKDPSAELHPNQKDSDRLPPYEVLDAILRLHIVHNYGTKKIVAETSFDEATVSRVIHMTAVAEHKRQQGALPIRVSSKVLGIDRVMPTNCHIPFL